MSGPRILLAVLAIALAMIWLALASGDEDLERGLQESEAAITRLEAELQALAPSYQALRSQGLVLGLREQHDRVVMLLARHKDRRVQVRTDPSIDPRQRLSLLRELVTSIDETLATAVVLRRTLDAVVAFRRDAEPTLAEARRLHGRLQALDPPPAADWSGRRASLAAALADLDQRLAQADRLLRDNPEQGGRLGDRALSDLRTLMDGQRGLLREAGQEP
jgi:hypothetical protein